MKKILIIAFFSVFAIILSGILGLLIYEVTHINNINTEEKVLASEKLIDDDCTEYVKKQENVIQTMANESKISPNAIIIFKTYYKKCNHMKQETKQIPIELVNLKKNDLRNYYKEYEVKGFSSNEIVLYKEINEFCNEHYKLKNSDGYVSIYNVKENGEEELKERTDINITFLPEVDKSKIENGIEIIGEENLNKAIEDFE